MNAVPVSLDGLTDVVFQRGLAGRLQRVFGIKPCYLNSGIACRLSDLLDLLPLKLTLLFFYDIDLIIDFDNTISSTITKHLPIFVF
jgi:hypothetical protein